MKKSVRTSLGHFTALVAILLFCSSFVIASKGAVSHDAESAQFAASTYHSMSKHSHFLAKTALLFGAMGAFRFMHRRHRRHYDSGGGGCCGVIVGLGLIVAAVVFLPLLLGIAVVVGVLAILGLVLGLGRGRRRRIRM